jgi:hypothetical protein
MSANEFPPLIYVDLIEVREPKARKLLGPVRTRWQPWRVSILSGNNMRRLFRGSERWTNRQDALDAIALAFGGGSNVYLREAEHGNQVLRMAAE